MLSDSSFGVAAAAIVAKTVKMHPKAIQKLLDPLSITIKPIM
jgi:hypothetical protein